MSKNFCYKVSSSVVERMAGPLSLEDDKTGERIVAYLIYVPPLVAIASYLLSFTVLFWLVVGLTIIVNGFIVAVFLMTKCVLDEEEDRSEDEKLSYLGVFTGIGKVYKESLRWLFR